MARMMSAIAPMRAVSAWDAITGEAYSRHLPDVRSLLEFVRTESETIYQGDKERIESTVTTWKGAPQPAEFARQNDIKLVNRDELIANKVKAISRVEKLVQANLVSSVASHVSNPNPRKSTPTMSDRLILGAVDKQMITMSIIGKELTLLWKVWDKELLLEFEIPEYVIQKRKVLKWCLPTVTLSRKTGEVVFGFSYMEEPALARKDNGKRAGVDLGLVEPYSAVVLGARGGVEARYTASPWLRSVNAKRERILSDKARVLRKRDALLALGLSDRAGVLEQEARRLGGKASRLGTTVAQWGASELSRKLERHALHEVRVEYLKWATGARYGSKWNHGAQQEALEHALRRKGSRLKRVSPSGTSQYCSSCGGRITHRSSDRTVWCGSCKSRLDRDFNAALNIAKNKSYPADQRASGSDCTGGSVPPEVTGVIPGSVVRDRGSTHVAALVT